MPILDKARDVGYTAVIQTIANYAAHGAKKDPDGTLRKMITAAKKLTNDPLWSAVLDGLLERLDRGHPGMGVARKFLTQLNAKSRNALLRNLFVKGTLLGPAKRHAIEDELGYYPPSTFVISPSMRCPLHCYGCYAGEYSKEDELSFEEVDRIINEGKEMGVHFIVISGGEPFAWEPLMDVFAKHQDVFFLVFTSGLLFTPQVIDQLVEQGNVCPAISCEGFEEETDRRRGKGAFKKVNEAMAALRDRGNMLSFSATATRENVDVVTSDEFIDHWIEMGCLMGWYFIYMPIGRHPVLELMPTPEQRVKLGNRVRKIRESKEIVVIDFWNDGEHAGGCIAGGRKYFHINNQGDVEPCVFCHFAKANIREQPLKEALANDFFQALRARQPYNPDLRRPCVMIDNPHVLREVVAETGAYPTHKGAESLITEFADYLDKYAEVFGEALRDAPVANLKHHV